MRYDDRLLTVLNQPAGDRHDTAVRWRQLVDLIARAGTNAASPIVAQAIDEIREQRSNVDEDLRAAAARAVAALPLPLALLELFASDRLAVCAPVLAAATLDASQWRALIDVAEPETSRFIETLHPEIKSAIGGSSPSDNAAGDPLELTEPFVEAPEQSSIPSLHDVVERIERRQRERRTAPTKRPANSPALFRWECGPSGEIAWVEGANRGPLVGRSIARGEDGEGNRIDAEAVRAFSLRAPFRDALLTVAGESPVAGEWRISGLPAFEPIDGRFAGYRGVALREATDTGERPGDLGMSEVLADPDSLRELVHEIKTPLNAIIGFAEIIDGQYLGPADHRYRERAAEIVAQARLLLMAIDDLDFAAKTHSASRGSDQRTDLGRLAEQMAPTLREIAAGKGAEIEASRFTGATIAHIEPELADRLIFRMASALIERATDGERLRFTVDGSRGRCQVSLSRPDALHGVADNQLFDSHVGGGEFALRLVRGLARIAGADLITTPAAVSLVFKRA